MKRRENKQQQFSSHRCDLNYYKWWLMHITGAIIVWIMNTWRWTNNIFINCPCLTGGWWLVADGIALNQNLKQRMLKSQNESNELFITNDVNQFTVAIAIAITLYACRLVVQSDFWMDWDTTSKWNRKKLSETSKHRQTVRPMWNSNIDNNNANNDDENIARQVNCQTHYHRLNFKLML